jgi:hypothetical protein
MHKAKKGETKCMYCCKEHDEVDVGKCSAIDSIRPPQAGESFIGLKGFVVRARFDFTEQEFAVLHF